MARDLDSALVAAGEPSDRGAVPSGRTRQPTRRDRQKRATREALRAAALRLFATRGFRETTADEIAAAAGFIRKQPFIRPEGMVVIGHSAGAWGALALAGEEPKDVAAIVAFAPGRGGHANDFPNRVCAPHTLMAAAAEFGKAARVKVAWLVAANDSYFSPAFSRQLVDAFRGAGGKADFHVLPAHGGEGHWLVETEGGVKLAGGELDRALKARSATPAKKR